MDTMQKLARIGVLGVALLAGCDKTLSGQMAGDDKVWQMNHARQRADAAATQSAAAEPVTRPAERQAFRFPVKVSGNGRYFVDQDNKPIYWIGTTNWELCRMYNPEEAKLALDRTAAAGFTFVQVMVLGRAEDNKTGPNYRGEMPWINDDPLRPNEAYFQNADAVVKMAGEGGLVITMTMYHQRLGKYITEKNGRAWARWLASRYKDTPNLIWAEHPKADLSYLPVLRELAAGLKEGDGGRHLIGSKPDPSPFSSSFIHNEPWLDYNTIQTWKDVQLIYPMTKHDYDLKPVKPVIMGEGVYEDSDNRYGFTVTPLIVRRQAYYTCLAGGFHGFGERPVTGKTTGWQAGLDSPGTKQMGVLKKIFTDLPEWWRLVPDQTVLAKGGMTEGKVLHLADRHAEGRWAIVYLADKATVTVRMSKLAGSNVRATWIDPRTGAKQLAVGDIEDLGTLTFTTPEGWEDAVLVLETGESKK